MQSDINQAITALRTAIAATEEAQKAVKEAASTVSKEAERAEPTKWSRYIEDSLGEFNTSFDFLRVQFVEKSLTLVSAQLRHYIACQSLQLTFKKLTGAVVDVICILGQNRPLSSDTRSLMKCLVVAASELHSDPGAQDQPVKLEKMVVRASDHLLAAFGKLSGDLEPKLARGRLVYYPTAPVVSARLHRPHADPSEDLRLLFKLALPDSADTLPHSVRLLAAHSALEEARSAALAAKEQLSLENQSLDEQRHADRLLHSLHHVNHGRGEQMLEQIKSQNRLRRNCEFARLELLQARTTLQIKSQQLMAALLPACLEMTALQLELVSKPASVCRQLQICVAMNNCLAADAYLRAVGRLLDLINSELRDLTLGKGFLVVEADYEKAVDLYRPFKPEIVVGRISD